MVRKAADSGAFTKGPEPGVLYIHVVFCSLFLKTRLERPGHGCVHSVLFVPFAFGRAVRELEAQLESERVRREKLESQLDGCRAEIGRLRESRGRTRSPAALPPVSGTGCSPAAWAPVLAKTVGWYLSEYLNSFQLGTVKQAAAFAAS